MAHVLIMPRQGNTVESCILVEWKVKEGDAVTDETEVCSVETDKAAFDVPAGADGVVLKLLRAAGDDVPVLEPIAVIGAAGGDWQAAIAEDSAHRGTEAQREIVMGKGQGEQQPPSPPPRAPAPPREASAGISPRARKLAEKEALSIETVPGTGPGGRVIERDVRAALEARPALTAAAKALGSRTLPAAGSGMGGRVTAEDLAGLSSPATDTPIKGIRKIIADRMSKSLAETAQLTLNTSAPVSRLQDLRSRMKNCREDSGLSKVTVNDLVLFAVSRTLPGFPFMNAHKTGDAIRVFEEVHLGIAVDTPRGLMVPVIRRANTLSLARISAEAKRLALACQDGSVKPDELSGSTFTVTNLGSLGISSFTPVLNIPEVAILGVCSIELKPVANANGLTAERAAVNFEPHIGFSLTINHQAVDGAPAARFLKALCDAVANIDLLLLEA